MALDLQSLMLRLNPSRPLDLGSGQEIEQMRLMREKFEEEKRMNREQIRMREMAEANDLAQAELGLQKSRDAASAKANAAKLVKQQEALKAFTDAGGASNAEAMESQIPYINSLGGNVIQRLGETGGMPSYRIATPGELQQDQQDLQSQAPYGAGETAEESLSRLGSMGLQPGRGVLSHPAGIGSTEEAFARAQQASQNAAEAGGLPARAPDEEDTMGAVPGNVIDLGAQHAMTMKRLSPMLQSAVDAHPDPEMRGSAQAIREMAEQSGLPLDKAAELYNKNLGEPASNFRTKVGAEAQQDRFREQRDELTRKGTQELITVGETRAKSSFDKQKIGAKTEAMASADQVIRMMTNEDKYDDERAVNYLMLMAKNKGAQTERDAERVVGIKGASSLDQVRNWFEQRVDGGLPDDVRNSIVEFAEALRAQDTADVFSWLDSMNKEADGNRDALVGEGYRTFLNTISADVRAEYDEYRGLSNDESVDREQTAGEGGDEATAEAAVGTDDFAIELEAQALENDLDPDKMAPIIRHESGGSASARNPQSGATGIIQFMPSVAKDLGTSVEALAQMSAAEQLPWAMKYLKKAGLDSDSPPEDYAMAVAAPAFIGEPDDTVVYPQGSKAWEQNAPWRPGDGGDITVGDILAFYGLRERRKGTAEKAAETPPETELDQDVLNILKD